MHSIVKMAISMYSLYRLICVIYKYACSVEVYTKIDISKWGYTYCVGEIRTHFKVVNINI